MSEGEISGDIHIIRFWILGNEKNKEVRLRSNFDYFLGTLSSAYLLYVSDEVTTKRNEKDE